MGKSVPRPPNLPSPLEPVYVYPMTDSADPQARVDRRGTAPGTGTHAGWGGGGLIGQPPHEPTDETRAIVRENFAVNGRTWCAIQIGCSVDTVSRHYKPEIEISNATACALVATAQFKKAIEGDGASQRFFLITRGKGEWSPKIKHEHTGADGGPIHTVNITPFLEGKTDEQLAFIEQLLEQIAASGGTGIDASDLGISEADPGL